MSIIWGLTIVNKFFLEFFLSIIVRVLILKKFSRNFSILFFQKIRYYAFINLSLHLWGKQ